ncbi:MAG: hypothetical protein K0Q68_2851 [Moraxellaceae bacterium]|nr:hypothetical protein [Moraxellaceae bacterium]
MAKFHWRIFLLRWHRRIGIVSALFVLLLAITGILLNHTHELGLDRKPLENATLRSLYGAVPESAPQGLVHGLAAGELYAAAGRLRVGDRDLGDCPQLVGVVERTDQILAVCSNRLWLLTPAGEVIDQADSVRGVPEGLSAVAEAEGQVLLKQGGQSFAVDLGDLSLKPTLAGEAVDWSGALAPAAAADAADLDWEQVLLDLHSGRILGAWGVWLMDAMALLFIVLAVSGLFMARRRHRRT